jgi:hypothetical protein
MIRIVILSISLRDYPRFEDNEVFYMFDFYLMDTFILDSRITDFVRSLCNMNFDWYLRFEDNTIVSIFD